jgi:hypothetical protein
VSTAEFRRSERVLWRRAGADVVAALPESAEVQRLSGGAGAVWRALEEPGTAKALVDDLAMLFGVASDALMPEVSACLEELVSIGLVERS